MRDYPTLLKTLDNLVSNEKYLITLLSNASSLIKQFMEDTNWVGFYLYQDDQLILGPFQGLVACEIISLDKGVCGKCAREKQTILVENVHHFPGHIACDSASNSEIVVPILIRNELYGLLDIDSPSLNSFNQVDKENLEEVVKILEKYIQKFF